MSRTISNLKDSVAALLSGIDINNVDNLYPAFERAARVFVQKAKIPETLGTQNLIIYDKVTDYLINSSIYGTQVIDIRPQGISRNQNDFVFKKFQDDFDRNKSWTWQGTQATFTYSAGTPIIRIASSHTRPATVLDGMNSKTGWVAGGSASGLALDETFYYQQPGALRFNLANAGSQGTLTKTINSIDLTPYFGVGVAFMAVELPTTGFTSFELRIGSSSGNYYTVTNTTGTLGFSINEWMLVAFDQSLATTVGIPDITKISYIQVLFNYNGTVQANVRVGDLFIALPTPMQVLYMTAGFFSVAGVVSNSITADTDVIILNDSAYTIYEYECALSVLQQIGGATSDSMTARIDNILNGAINARTGAVVQLGLYENYKSDNPSESLRSVGFWYDNNQSYSNDGVI
jgi:hypothetical protein